MCDHCGNHQEPPHDRNQDCDHEHGHTHVNKEINNKRPTKSIAKLNDQTLRVAVTGKGGVGKSTLSGALARRLSTYQEVIAVDADPDRNLSTTIGCESPTPITDRETLIQQRAGRNGLVRMNPEIDDVFPDCSSSFGENGKLVTIGTPETANTGCLCPEQNFVRSFVSSALESDVAILDMEAGVEHLSRGTAKSVDSMIIVAGPSQTAIETVETIKLMADDLGIDSVYVVLNKIRDGQYEQIAGQIDIPVIETIPYEDEIMDAALNGRPPIQASVRLEEAADRIIDVLTSSEI